MTLSRLSPALFLPLALVCCATPPADTVDAGAAFLFASDSGTPGSVDSGIRTSTEDSGLPDDDAGTPDLDDAGPPPIVDAGEPDDAGPIDLDAGLPPVSDGGMDLGDTVPNSPAVCTSGVYWLLGNVGTSVMNPGQACITCHSAMHGPTFTAAGTVYPTAHEPDNCDGQISGWTIVITDAAGNKISLTPNLAGNFDTSSAIVYPYTVQITSSTGYTREMVTPQSTGDCNSCHTQDGANGAPGRIVAP